MKKILILAGGTGGHIFPALAVARALRKEGADVHWLGSRVGMEADLVADEFPMFYVSVTGIRGKSLSSKLFSPFRLLLATWQAWRVVKQFNPDLVLGMGGFVSGPAGLAARFARKPLVIHEQNAIPGLTNRVLSKMAKVVLQGFPDTFPKNIKAETIGNPVRPIIAALAPPAERLGDREGPLRILVLGGSRGASAINQAMVSTLSQYPDVDELHVWHQTGKLDFETTQRSYRTISVRTTVEAFIKNMAEAYGWADLVICRSGALTVSEVAVVGLASILIPYPYAVDDHQFYNGSYLANAGAAEIVRQKELTDERLTRMIQSFVKDRHRLITMADTARTLAKPEALSMIVDTCQRLANHSEQSAHEP